MNVYTILEGCNHDDPEYLYYDTLDFPIPDAKLILMHSARLPLFTKGDFKTRQLDAILLPCPDIKGI